MEVDTADQIEPTGRFYAESFGLSGLVDIGIASAPSSGFRGFAPSLILEQPADVDLLFDRAIAAGAEVLKPVVKSMWGYGGSLRAPDGTVWQIASASKKNTGEATGKVERLVLLTGVADVKASKRFYEDQGVMVAKSFGGKYVEFSSGDVTLALYKRGELAKQVGVDAAAGTGSHRVTVVGDGEFTDPDGFSWVSAPREGDSHR
ncbi:glyoxalase [Microbacterium sp. H1-D42]|uniref:glyoxalase n=1 Tax=Microbacterium sp. H1-D42 TaxID=2925844 RepID=UPI001F53DEBD|nr:glyoxalase [Microbacterium sp. H1-D42]UNK69290.1 glyoxalase [Microbacterium sp. H1-D42]